LKRIIKILLRKIGYEIRPLNLNGALNSIDYNTPQGTDKFYGNTRLAEDYIKNNIPVHIQNLISLLQKKKLDFRNKKIIDVGCGTGHCLERLKSLYTNSSLTGIEISDEAIKIAIRFTKDIPILKADILSLPVTDKYDLVLCQQVLEHIPEAEFALIKLWELVAENGYLIITVPDGRLDSFAGHIHFWSKESFMLLLSKTLPAQEIEINHLQDGVSLYALIQKKPGTDDLK
jgi:2-polyprenyl-3-methyl-5-hydroxy-6-metoxy-1,4-benzoquinol methylase